MTTSILEVPDMVNARLRFPAARLLAPALSLAALAVLAGLGAIAIGDPAATGSGPIDPAAGSKNRDRLSFVEDETLTRSVRISDSIAMFALPQADSRTWTERPVSIREEDRPASVPRPTAPRMPRIAAIEAGSAPRPAILPPTRPSLANDGRPAPATVVASAEPDATEPRRPVRVLGVSLPGTQYVPTGQDVLKATGRVGEKAASAGGVAVDAAKGAASRIGGAVVGLGEAVADLFGDK